MRLMVRIRRVIKFVGALTSACVLIVWLVSMCWTFSFADLVGSTEWGEQQLVVNVTRGAVYCSWRHNTHFLKYATVYRHSETVPLNWLPTIRRRTLPGFDLTLPLWIPLLVVALPIAWLFRRDRQCFSRYQCQHCGYNLTGNVSGTCPECGTRQ